MLLKFCEENTFLRYRCQFFEPPNSPTTERNTIMSTHLPVITKIAYSVYNALLDYKRIFSNISTLHFLGDYTCRSVFSSQLHLGLYTSLWLLYLRVLIFSVG